MGVLIEGTSSPLQQTYKTEYNIGRLAQFKTKPTT